MAEDEAAIKGFPEFLTVKDVGEIFKLPLSTVRTPAWQVQTGLHPLRIGRLLRFDADDVRAMVERSRGDRSLAQ